MRLRIACALALALLVTATAGCTGGTTKKTADEAPPASVVATGDIPGEALATAGDLEFIRSLGKSHKGETLFALVVASEKTEAAATKAALDTISQVGDVQAYFVVEPASHMAGLPEGMWYVFEAYRASPSQDTIDFMDRGPSPATVYKVTVKCTDPIPVVEDLEGDGTQ
jgi:FAD/FMN-containing dehydrogenase